MDKRNVDIVLVRMDKIGDLVLSLPVDEHPVFAGRNVYWFITQGLGFLTEQAAPKRQTVEFKRRFSIFEFFRMVSWLRKHKPQSVVLLHCPWWVSMAAWLAGVPERVGRQSQWHSFLFLNVGVRQKRSAGGHHESDFNFDLVEAGFQRVGLPKTAELSIVKNTYLRLVSPNPFGTLASRGLKSQGYRVVHPGMAGSALNWPQQNYVELIEKLSAEMPVLITGTKTDEKYLASVAKVKALPNVHWLVDELKMGELLDLLSQARSVTAPSTGVLHLAASLGTPVVGIYSPRTAEHPRRWGPRGLYVTHLVPNAEGDVTEDVMKQVTVDQVYSAVLNMERRDARHSSESRSTV